MHSALHLSAMRDKRTRQTVTEGLTDVTRRHDSSHIPCQTTTSKAVSDKQQITWTASQLAAEYDLYTLSGRTTVFDRRTFPSMHLTTCSWWVTIYIGKPSAIGQLTRPTQTFILQGVDKWVVSCNQMAAITSQWRRRLVNAYEVGRVWCICRVKTVWSIPERFWGEVLTTG